MNSDFSAKKILTGEDVLCAAVNRIEWLFETFSSVCLSFSGGKDSTVLLHLTADVARRKKRRFSVSGCDGDFLLGGTPPDYGKRCLSVSAGMDMLGTRCGVGSSATR